MCFCHPASLATLPACSPSLPSHVPVLPQAPKALGLWQQHCLATPLPASIDPLVGNFLLPAKAKQQWNSPALVSGAFQGDEIQATRSAVWWRAGNTGTLRCTYRSNASYIYVAWYRQHPGGPLQYLLQSKGRGGSYSHTAPFAHKRFSCQADKSSGTLIISGLELGDSALYYCTLQGPQ